MQCETKRDCWSERDYDVVWDSVTTGAACPAAPRHPVSLWTGPGAISRAVPDFLQNNVTLHSNLAPLHKFKILVIGTKIYFAATNFLIFFYSLLQL